MKKGLYQLFNDDCLTIMKSLPDCSIDLIVSDVPYRIISGGVRIENKGDETAGVLRKRLLEKNELKGRSIKNY